jgi:dihydropteroate synthase
MTPEPFAPFEWGKRTYIMGIINVTPDSFSGDGLLRREDMLKSALQQAEIFLRNGADILDIGGESTRPGAKPVAEAEEMERVIPVVSEILNTFPEVRISVDTYKPAVARKALEIGAQWVNDIWGFRADPLLADVVAEFDAPVVLMHNRLQPGSAELGARLGGHFVGIHYDDLIEDICNELMFSVSLAHKKGIPDDHIILDPGIGFGKTVEQNLTLIDQMDKIKALGYPILVGPSRKSFIGYTLDLPADERVEGTAAAVSVCIDRGADIVRVHDVTVMARVARMTDAIVR